MNIDGLDLTITMEQPQEAHAEHGDHAEHQMDENNHDQMDHADMNHGDMTMHSHHNMPGMLTQAQLEELADARGREFDRKFLSFMIQHHEGAVIMVKNLFDTDGAAWMSRRFGLHPISRSIKSLKLTG